MVSRRRPPHVYLPISAVTHMTDYISTCQILRAAGRIDPDPNKWLPNYKLIGVKHDDLLSLDNEFSPRKNIKVRVFDMDHSVPCCGYGFYECRQKLKKEFQHLSGKDIGMLRKTNGVEVTEEVMIPLFAFMGDTTAVIFNEYGKELLQFPVIIVECSFIDNDLHGERAADVKHIIWDELQPFVLQHPNTIFVLIHFSQQYKCEQIKQFFQKLNLPNVVPFL
ncbi:unnamed protein product [Didymodactylos carnosus]|nr:unnamed protein product [Didymodactylos carnosus]CAF4540149.1 unnamed protein product [Didymodactylos carnosus]